MIVSFIAYTSPASENRTILATRALVRLHLA
jgi:hypothetical protein